MTRAEGQARVIWQLGDPWRDLLGEVRAEPCTAVTSAMTTHVIDRPSGMHARFAANADVVVDGAWLRLDQIVTASPCGLHLLGPAHDHWFRSTPLVIVLAGVVRDWRAHPAWLDVDHLAQADGERAWNLAGHSKEPCGALHCRRLAAADAASDH